MIIAIIGSPLSGKTSVLKELQEHGVPVFHTDSYITEIYKRGNEGYELIKNELGQEFVNEDSVNRRRLAEWASEDDNLNRLNELIHPLIKNYLEGKDDYVAEIPIISTSPIKFNYDKIVLVKASKEVINERFNKKNLMNPKFINQIVEDWNTSNQDFDFVVDTTNGVNHDDIHYIIDMLHGK